MGSSPERFFQVAWRYNSHEITSEGCNLSAVHNELPHTKINKYQEN